MIDPADEIIVPNHGFETGQGVTYRAGDGSPTSGLADSQQYFVIRLDDNRLQLAASPDDAAAGTAITLGTPATQEQRLEADTVVMLFDASRSTPVVDFTNDTIELIGHGFQTGDVVTYQTAGGSPIGGLADGTDYEVIVVDADTIQLKQLSGSPNAIKLSAGATIESGFHAFALDVAGTPPRLFDPTAVQPVDSAADTIRILGHGFDSGDRVTYLSGPGTAIGGLDNGAEYFVIRLDDETIQLADATDPNNVPTNPASLTPLALSGGATGDGHGLERASTATVGDVPITGLEDGQLYFVIKVDNNTIRLADSVNEALAATPIDLDPSVATGLVHTLDTGTGAGINVRATLDASNSAVTGAGLGSVPGISDFLTMGELQNPGLDFFRPSSFKPSNASSNSGLQKGIFSAGGVQSALKGTDGKTNSTFSAAVGFAFSLFEHNVVATVGPSAVLQSDQDVLVEATIEEKVQLSSQGNLTSDVDSSKKFALSAAVGLGFYDNVVEAIVSSGATIDARDDVIVNAELTYPLLVTPLELLPFSSFFPDGKFDPDLETNAANPIGDLASLLDGKLGLGKIVNNWAATKAIGSGGAADVTVAGSVGVSSFDNTARAVIGADARINQDPAFQTSTQSVLVHAATKMELVNVSGILHLKLNDVGIRNAVKGKTAGKSGWLGQVFSPFGNQAGTFGLGGSFVVQLIENETVAVIEDGVRAHAGTSGILDIRASEDVFTFDFAQSGGTSGAIGLSGSLSYVEQASRTIAEVGSGAVLSGGPLTVDADDQTSHISLAGAVQLAETFGVGVSVGYTEIDRQTAALIGDREVRFEADGVDSAADTIRINNHGLETGDRVLYRDLGDAGAIGGLTDGDEYIVIALDEDTLQLAATLADATANNPTPVTLDSAGASAEHSLSLVGSVFEFDTQAVNTTSNALTLVDHGLLTGDAVVYRNPDDSADDLGGLTDGEVYFVERVSDDEFRLSDASGTVSLGTTGGVNHRLERALRIETAGVTVGASNGGKL